ATITTTAPPTATAPAPARVVIVVVVVVIVVLLFLATAPAGPTDPDDPSDGEDEADDADRRHDPGQFGEGERVQEALVFRSRWCAFVHGVVRRRLVARVAQQRHILGRTRVFL